VTVPERHRLYGLEDAGRAHGSVPNTLVSAVSSATRSCPLRPPRPAPRLGPTAGNRKSADLESVDFGTTGAATWAHARATGNASKRRIRMLTEVYDELLTPALVAALPPRLFPNKGKVVKLEATAWLSRQKRKANHRVQGELLGAGSGRETARPWARHPAWPYRDSMRWRRRCCRRRSRETGGDTPRHDDARRCRAPCRAAGGRDPGTRPIGCSFSPKPALVRVPRLEKAAARLHGSRVMTVCRRSLQGSGPRARLVGVLVRETQSVSRPLRTAGGAKTRSNLNPAVLG
jgi:hypothetical protein